MKKKPTIFLTLILIMLVTAACTSPGPAASEDPKETVTFSYMEGVTALTAAKMMKENTQVNEAFEIEYKLLRSTDLLTSSIMNGEADMAIIPSTLAASAYNRNLGYTLVGTATWGNLYLIGTEEVASFEALSGKTVTTFGQGLTPDLVFRLLLEKNNMDPEGDLTLNYLASATEVGPYLLSGKASLAILPEPAVSGVIGKSEGKAKVLLDLNGLWAEAMGVEKGYPQASLVIKNSLIEAHPEMVEAFIGVYMDSIQWGLDNPDLLGELSEELELGPGKGAVISGIDRMNIGDFPIEDAREEYEAYYEAIMAFAPDFIGGKMPDEGLYYK